MTHHGRIAKQIEMKELVIINTIYFYNFKTLSLKDLKEICKNFAHELIQFISETTELKNNKIKIRNIGPHP